MQNLIQTFKRHQTLLTHKIKTLPIAIIMPHSACNCMCVMCDIWKGNKNSKQLSENDIKEILASLKKLNTKMILMSGGEALLNKNFFTFCELIKKQNIKITLLSTGLTIAHHADKIMTHVDALIVSLDGDEVTHNSIRNIKNAYSELKRGVQTLKQLNPNFPISGRSVIHRLNYQHWDKIIIAAKEIGLDSISFLPADVSSEAFNRVEVWEKEKQESVLVPKLELEELQNKINQLVIDFEKEFSSKFIVESPQKIRKIYQYYAAHYDLAEFPAKKCNAPWVSAVVEADGTLRPCFFHDAIGNIKNESLLNLINSKASIEYRKNLNINTNKTCIKCVCYLNLQPHDNLQ